MSVEAKFIEELKGGNVHEAIDIIKTELAERARVQVAEVQTQVAEKFGLAKKDKDDSDDEGDDDDEGDEDDDSDKDDDEGDKE